MSTDRFLALWVGLSTNITIILLAWGVAAQVGSYPISSAVERETSPVGGRLLLWNGDQGCAQTVNGKVHCWKKGEAVRPILGIKFPLQVEQNGDSICFLGREGVLGCLGGIGAILDELRGTNDSETPESDLDAPVKPSWLAQGVKSFALGYGYETAHICVIERSGGVACAGNNEHGQLGDGTRISRGTFASVIGEDAQPLRDVKSLDLTPERSCAVAHDGTLYCWGRNDPGEQARAYHGPKRYLMANRVPLDFKVAAMGESCMIGVNHQEYCWPIVDETTQKVSYRPLARPRCNLEAEVSLSQCVRDRGGRLTCDHQGQRYTRTIGQQEKIDGKWDKVCLLAGASSTCFSSDATNEDMELLGFVSLSSQASPSENCEGEAPQEEVPAFPPHPFEKVLVVPLRRGFVREPGLPLDDSQVEVLSQIASSPRTYTNMSTCHNPSLLFEFIDEDGESVAQMSGWGCPTLGISPAAPARFFADGNVVSEWAEKRMIRFENSL